LELVKRTDIVTEGEKKAVTGGNSYTDVVKKYVTSAPFYETAKNAISL
jgi:hypothetical protein